jgi:hypothetical protein
MQRTPSAPTPNPSPLYVTIRNMAMEQVDVLDEIMRRQEVGQSVRVARMRTLWADTLPAALDQPFAGLESLSAGTR